MTPRTVLKGGTVVDSRGERKADVAIENGSIVEVGTSLKGEQNLDVTGCVVAPGFVDLHAHLREPGKEEAETIETGSRAGAKGGYTALVAMPNTDPAQDSVAVIDFVREQGKRAGLVEVVPSGCITLGRKGEALAPMAELAAAGVRIFTDEPCCLRLIRALAVETHEEWIDASRYLNMAPLRELLKKPAPERQAA